MPRVGGGGGGGGGGWGGRPGPRLAPLGLALLLGFAGWAEGQSSTPNEDKINPLDVQNQNSNEHLSTDGTFWTLGINLTVFGIFCLIFEANRFYPQIYLKRCEKKFIDTSRVPPRPSEHTFGWLRSLWQVSEEDLLGMVGLDGYMLLRFHVVCLKLCCFLSFWGLLVLTPLYSTAAITSTWDTYTLTNVLKGEDRMKFRLWAAAVFGYIFSAYFCKLLQTEYNAFCIRRLIYLTQQYNQETAVEGGALSGDPDTPQQTYYTVMVERLPKELRSPQKLRNYFDDIFPGEVYAVEVMYDLSELNSLCAKRRDIQNKLEHAIADYEVTNNRPVVFLQSERSFLSPAYPPELEARYLPPITSWVMLLDRMFAPEEYGFEPHDAIHHYTNQLIELNKKVKELQEPHDDSSPRPSGAAGAGGDSSSKSKSGKSGRSKDVLELAKEKGTVAGALASKFTDASNAGLKSTREYLKGFSATRAVSTFLFGAQTNDFSRELVKQERKAMRKTHRALSQSRERKNSKDASASPARSRTNSVVQQQEGDLAAAGAAGAGEGAAAGGGVVSEDAAALQGDGDHRQGRAGTEGEGEGEVENEEGESGSDDDEHEDLLDLDNVDPHELTPASFMRKLSVSRKASRSATESELAAQIAAAEQAASAKAAAAAAAEAEGQDEGEGESEGGDDTEPLEAPPAIPGVASRRPFSSGSRDDNDDDATPPASAVAPRRRQSAGPADISLNSSVEGECWRVQESPAFGGIGGARPASLFLPGELEGGADKPRTLSTMSQSSSGTGAGAGVGADTVAESGAEAGDESPGKAKSSQQRAKKRGARFGEQGVEVGTSPSGGSSSNGNMKGGLEMAKSTWRFLSTQASDAAEGLKRGLIEGEKLVEMMAWGSFYKLSSTAFVTFKSRVTTSIARQMLISHDDMQIVAAPNPKDIIWENIDKPRSLLVMRNAICEVGVIIASIFWSSLVTEVNAFSTLLNLPHAQQELLSVVILLCFLLILPFIFDWVSRNYECMKLESEIQNSIMNRYFWYQLINVYVTVGLGSKNFAEQLVGFLRNPQSIVDVLGKSVPAVSLYFCNLMIVKIFAAVPIEMLRPWQLSTIHLMYASMDTRKATRRDLRSGAFYAWPMLYGWVYPQLLMVLMIMVTYSTIAPLLPPFGVLFFIFAYVMYKYQLLYVYINDYQSGGFMWYAVFTRSVVAIFFASITLLGYLSLQMSDPFLGGPFWFLLPLPPAIVYFWYYCDAKYKRQSMELAFGYAKTIDHSSDLAGESGRPRPTDFFSPTLYRQPSLLEKAVFPEPHRAELLTRKHTASSLGLGGGSPVAGEGRQRKGSAGSADGDTATYNPLLSPAAGGSSNQHTARTADSDPVTRNRRGSMSLNVVELVDGEDDSYEQLEAYFRERVVPLSVIPEGHIPGYRAPVLEFVHHRLGSGAGAGAEPDIEAGAGAGTAVGGGRRASTPASKRRSSAKPRGSATPAKAAAEAPAAERSLGDINVGVGLDDEEEEGEEKEAGKEGAAAFAHSDSFDEDL